MWKPGVYHGAIGGIVSYTFTHTSIGIVSSISCVCAANLVIAVATFDPNTFDQFVGECQ